MNKKGFLNIILIVVVIAIIISGGYFIFSKKSTTPTGTKIQQMTQQIDTSDWKTYADSKSLFSIKYPPNLYIYIQVEGQQIFLTNQDATSVETIYDSDQLVEIRTDVYVGRFESYYNTPDNSFVKGYGDLKLRSYTINGYKAVEYGYDEIKKEKEIKQNDEALNSGASVGMIYFDKGLIINKAGTTIEISTNSYSGEFKNTFDQILSTFKSSAVVLESISPPSGPMGTKVIIRGSGFTSANNDIAFAHPKINFQGRNTAYLNRLSSPDGTTLSFNIPDNNNVLLGACAFSQLKTNEVCPDIGILLHKGTVQISVVNENGRSNSVKFTVK